MEDLFFSDEHKALRQTIRRFVEREITPHVEEWEAEGFFPNSLFPRMGELGFIGLSYPEELGGQGWDFMSSIVLTEELSRSGSEAVRMGIMIHTEMATPPILKFGSEELKQRYVVPAIKGEKIAALGITEPNAGSDVAHIETTARRDGDEWVINGGKIFITNGCRADFVTLIARTQSKGDGKGHGSFSLFVVDTDRPGFHVAKKLQKLGRCASDTAELALDEVRVPAANLIGEEGRGFKQIMWELQGERLTAAASNVAQAQLAWESAVKYAQERIQFDQPIANFQAIRHHLADLAARIEATRQLVYATSWRFARDQYPTTMISMCKLLSAQLACDTTDYALQVHGGYGYMAEYPISRWWRDARISRLGGGTDEIQREIIAKELHI